MTGPNVPLQPGQYIPQTGFSDQQKQEIIKLITNYINSGVDARTVVNIHRNSDVNGQSQALHHHIGTGRYDASAGSHTHDGLDSTALAEGAVFSGALVTTPTVASVGAVVKQIVMLLTTLGASDATT